MTALSKRKDKERFGEQQYIAGLGTMQGCVSKYEQEIKNTITTLTNIQTRTRQFKPESQSSEPTPLGTKNKSLTS
jgi:hypothetical protein